MLLTVSAHRGAIDTTESRGRTPTCSFSSTSSTLGVPGPLFEDRATQSGNCRNVWANPTLRGRGCASRPERKSPGFIHRGYSHKARADHALPLTALPWL